MDYTIKQGKEEEVEEGREEGVEVGREEGVEEGREMSSDGGNGLEANEIRNHGFAHCQPMLDGRCEDTV